jgi:hypothetical protein
MPPLKFLPLGLVFIGASSACGSAPDTPPPPAAPDPQPFTRTTQASPTTQAELGVVQWWAVYDPNGDMSIGGLDASNTVRVAFNTSPTQFVLEDAHGPFEIDLDGTKVSSTFNGNEGALRTLALIQMDLAPPDANGANATPASTSATADFGQLHLTGTGACGEGKFLVNCKQPLIDCSDAKKVKCMDDAGGLANAKASQAACLARWSPGGQKYEQAIRGECQMRSLPSGGSYCSSGEEEAKQYRTNCIWGDYSDSMNQSAAPWNFFNSGPPPRNSNNPPSYWQGKLDQDACSQCPGPGQWHIAPDTLLDCHKWVRGHEDIFTPKDTCVPSPQ